MANGQMFDEIRLRLQSDINHFGGELPARFAIAWRAYLEALVQWQVIDSSVYDALIALVPPVFGDAPMAIPGGGDSARHPHTSGDVLSALTAQIRRDISQFGGALPERAAIGWRAYLSALLEWDVISIAAFDELVAHLPSVPDDPSAAMALGREDWASRIHDDMRRFGGQIPEREALAWRGYLAALWEWDEFDTRKYHELVAMVPARDDASGDIVREHDRARWREEGRRETSEEIRRELRERIQRDIDYFVGELPERFAIAWQAYLLAVLSARLIEVEAYDELIRRIPAVPGDPVGKVFLRRED